MKTTFTVFDNVTTSGTSSVINNQSDITHANIFYQFSGQVAGSSVTFHLQTRDPAGNFSYILDSQTLTGAGVTGVMATLPSPTAQGSSAIAYGCRGQISNIVSGSASMFIDTFR